TVAVPVMLYAFMIYCWYQFHILKSGSTSATKGRSTSLRQPYLWLFFAMVLLVIGLVISLIIVAIRKRISLVSTGGQFISGQVRSATCYWYHVNQYNLFHGQVSYLLLVPCKPVQPVPWPGQLPATGTM
ncbi:hypothetical protein Ahia01_000668200, partial [Argonauta hians]